MEDPAAKKRKTTNPHNYLQCFQDNHIFEDPHLLQCFHIYCQDCLLQMKQYQKEEYLCEVCEIPTSSKQLIPCKIMSQFAQKYRDSQNQLECSNCDSVMVSTCYKCFECQVLFCSDKCKERHIRLPLYKLHQILPYSKESNEKKVSPLSLCSEHTDKRLELNCKDCKRLICPMCKQTNHETHTIQSVAIVKPSIRCLLHRDKTLELNCKDCRKLICLMCKVTDHQTHATTSLAESIQFYLQETENYRKTMRQVEDVIISTKYSAQMKRDAFNDSVDAKLELLKEYKDKLLEQRILEYKYAKIIITSQQEELNHYYEQIIKEERNKLACVKRAQKWSKLVEVHAEGECLLTMLQSEVAPQMKALCERLNQTICIRKPEEVKEYLVVVKTDKPGLLLKDQFRIMKTGNDNTVNPWYNVDLASLDTKVRSSTTAEWKYNIPDSCWSVLALNNRILAPLWCTNTIHVISLSGELMMKKQYPVDVECYSIHQLTDSELLLGTTTGLYVLDSTTLDIKRQIYNRGEVAYPFVHDNEIVGLDSTKNEAIILVFNGSESEIILEKYVKLQGWGNILCGDTVVKRNAVMYVASHRTLKLYQYNIDGKVMVKYSGEGLTDNLDIVYRRLLGVWKLGEVVWLEKRMKYLKVMKSTGEVLTIDLNHIWGSSLINVHIRDKMWVVMRYRQSQQDLFRYSVSQYHLP